MVLVVDEYHLDIRADGDLIGRYYLADVEVARDIAERFILFLGDDEMEFLADDALQFAYDGVAAMQEAWLAAQKKKRRHRRAAAESARRKEEEQLVPPPKPAPVKEPEVTRPTRTRPAAERTGSQSELAKRIAAASRLEQAVRQQSPPPPPPPEEDLLELLPIESPPVPEPTVTPGEGEADFNGRRSTPPHLDEEVVQAKPRRPTRRKPEPVFDEDEEPPTPPKAKKRAAASAPSPPKRIARTVEEVVDREETPPPPPPVAPPPPEPSPAEEEPVTTGERFAPAGHHPAETSVGLLSRLRRQPKVPTNHVHRFQESRSAVGLVRRVCVECSYVSIGSED
ncbi:MAG TPA: hypothetical protein VJR05_12975 [Acidimicrobiia bacterium]|nr:hypothetical protein [Acidimicrobiia bacterium]